MTPAFHLVTQQVARNPVARAIARDRIKKATLNFRIQLYTLEEGQDVASHLMAAGSVLSVAQKLCRNEGAEAPAIDAAVAALLDVPGCKWRKSLAGVFDAGLAEALDVYQDATAVQLQRAYMEVFGRAA